MVLSRESTSFLPQSELKNSWTCSLQIPTKARDLKPPQASRHISIKQSFFYFLIQRKWAFEHPATPSQCSFIKVSEYTHTYTYTHTHNIYIYTILKSGIVTTTQKNPKPSSPGCDEVTVTPLACWLGHRKWASAVPSIPLVGTAGVRQQPPC